MPGLGQVKLIGKFESRGYCTVKTRFDCTIPYYSLSFGAWRRIRNNTGSLVRLQSLEIIQAELHLIYAFCLPPSDHMFLALLHSNLTLSQHPFFHSCFIFPFFGFIYLVVRFKYLLSLYLNCRPVRHQSARRLLLSTFNSNINPHTRYLRSGSLRETKNNTSKCNSPHLL